MVREKNIATCVILSIITCGIYGIVWFITLTDDAAVASDDNKMSGCIFTYNRDLWNLQNLLELCNG